MSELINRQAAIDAIQKLNIPEDMCVFEIMSHIEVEIATLPSARPEPKWVPCSERLPEKAGVYLVTNYKGDVVRYTFNNSKTSKDYWKRCAKAWLPIPESYQEENAE